MAPSHPETVANRISDRVMVSSKKIDLTKVLSSLNATCSECGYSIPPNEQMRISMDTMRCPKCGKEFQRMKTEG